MSSHDKPQAPFLRRNAWILLALVALIFVRFGIGDLINGGDADPAIAESLIGIEWETLKSTSPDIARYINASSRILGMTLLATSILTLAIILTAFRRGKPWAWYVLWIWPLWFVTVFALIFTAERKPDFPPPPPMVTAPILFLITSVGLLLSYRNFFPKSNPEDTGGEGKNAHLDLGHKASE